MNPIIQAFQSLGRSFNFGSRGRSCTVFGDGHAPAADLSSFLVRASRRITRLPAIMPVAVGADAPDFSLVDATDWKKNVKLSELKGSKVRCLLNFSSPHR
jgi:hypothetical protein